MATPAATENNRESPQPSDKEADGRAPLYSVETCRFPRIDDPTPDFTAILNELTGELVPADDAEAESEPLVYGSKPWLRWPKTLDDVCRSDVQKQLYGYLSNRRVILELTLQAQTHVVDKAVEKGLAPRQDAPKAEFHSAILLAGGTSADWNYYASDTGKDVFRQDPFFRYLFGVNEPNLYGLLDLETRDAVLFYPSISPLEATVLGEMKSPEWYVNNYWIDEAVAYEDVATELKAQIKKRRIKEVLVLRGTNSDSGVDILPPPVAYDLNCEVDDSDLLYSLLCECRAVKTTMEIEFLRAACLVTCQAHVFVMHNLRPGMRELHAEALFRSFLAYAGAARHVPYNCICCSGENGSTLHYGHAGRPNDSTIQMGDMLLLDMGGEFQGYATDITMSYPICGTFSVQHRIVYSAVADAQRRVEVGMKPGVSWPSLHRKAEKIILQHLIRAKLLRGTVDECMKVHLGSIFMPHGLGHFLGLDTHDVGGYIGAKRSTEEGLKYLRTTRSLLEGMVITVEPGCYFIPRLIEKALKDPTKAKFMNGGLLSTYMKMGGVRLEDVVVVTRTGIINLTPLPRRLQDVKEVLAQRGVRPDVSPDIRPDVHPDNRPDVHPDNRPDVHPDNRPDVHPDNRPDVHPDNRPDVHPDNRPDIHPDIRPDIHPSDDDHRPLPPK